MVGVDDDGESAGLVWCVGMNQRKSLSPSTHSVQLSPPPPCFCCRLNQAVDRHTKLLAFSVTMLNLTIVLSAQMAEILAATCRAVRGGCVWIR